MTDHRQAKNDEGSGRASSLKRLGRWVWTGGNTGGLQGRSVFKKGKGASKGLLSCSTTGPDGRRGSSFFLKKFLRVQQASRRLAAPVFAQHHLHASLLRLHRCEGQRAAYRSAWRRGKLLDGVSADYLTGTPSLRVPGFCASCALPTQDYSRTDGVYGVVIALSGTTAAPPLRAPLQDFLVSKNRLRCAALDPCLFLKFGIS